MSEMEDKIGAILKNPELMQSIMSMASSLGAQQEKAEAAPPPLASQSAALPSLDPAMLQRIAKLAGQGNIDRNQQALLKALGPYLSRDRIIRLEKAMRAAKMARAASSVLGQGGLLSLSGR